jgi:hypothetical protein
MGAKVSKDRVEQMLETVFTTKTFNKCGTVSVDLDQQVGDIVAEEGCDATISITQQAYYKDDCALKTTIDSLTDFYVKNKQEIEEGLVPNIANVSDTSSRTTIRAEVQAEVDNICQEVAVAEKQVVGNVLCRGSKLKLDVLQKFYGKTACVVSELIKRADKWKSENEQDVTRASGFLDAVKGWFTMQLTMGILVVVAIVLIIGGLLWFMDRNPEKGEMIALAATGVPL